MSALSIWNWNRIRRFPVFPALTSGGLKKNISSCATRFQTANNQAKIDVLNVSLNYEKIGEGSHPVLCLPGALGTKTNAIFIVSMLLFYCQNDLLQREMRIVFGVSTPSHPHAPVQMDISYVI